VRRGVHLLGRVVSVGILKMYIFYTEQTALVPQKEESSSRLNNRVALK
jgi:hypothetical protein